MFKKLIKYKDLLVVVSIFLLVFIIYFVTSPGQTRWNYFVLLADAFNHGRLYLTQNPTWLNELVPVDGKYYVVYPPMPAILLMPYIFLFGEKASQTIFSILLGSLNVILVYLLCRRLNFSIKTSLLVTFSFAFGTNHWYLSSVGSAWFIGHITALFFLLLALLETFGKQRLLLIGLLLGGSFWARTPVIFTAVFFYIYFWRKFWPVSGKSIYNFLFLNLGVVTFVLLDAGYNFLRFNEFSPLSPYQLIPGIARDPIFQQGFMNISYIPRHIEAMFLKLPILIPSQPFLVPSLYSTAIWFTSPIFVFLLKAKRSLLSMACWAAILTTLSIVMLWGGVGFAQFGYRFAQDFMPFALILIALGIGQNPTKIAYFLVTFGILVNLWGVIMINVLSKWGW